MSEEDKADVLINAVEPSELQPTQAPSEEPIPVKKGKRRREPRLLRIPSSEIIYSKANELGEIIDFNDAFISISGFSPDFLLGKNHRILRHKDMPDVVFKDFYETCAAGHTWFGAVKNKSRTGDYYWVNASVIPKMVDGVPKEFESVRFPITDLKEIEMIEKAYHEIMIGERDYVPALEWNGKEGFEPDDMHTKEKKMFLTYSGMFLIVASVASLMLYPDATLVAAGALLVAAYLFWLSSKAIGLGEVSQVYEVLQQLAKGQFRKKIPPLGMWTTHLESIRTNSTLAATNKRTDEVRKEVMKHIFKQIRCYVLVTNHELVIREHSLSASALVDNYHGAKKGILTKLTGAKLMQYVPDKYRELLTTADTIKDGELVINDIVYDFNAERIITDNIVRAYVLVLFPTQKSTEGIQVREDKDLDDEEAMSLTARDEYLNSDR